MIKLSQKQARDVYLHAQHLDRFENDNLKILEHLGYVQIDTISVVERAHHHVFWVRNPKYRQQDLADLIESRQAFEFWSHAASILPMKDYRFSLPLKRRFSLRRKDWSSTEKKTMKRIYDRIKAEGPLRSKDFEHKSSGQSGWWDWKPAKQALERLFLSGKLEITHREGFQKVFDLSERVIPSTVDMKCPSPSAYARHLITKTLNHHGLATAAQAAYLRNGTTKNQVKAELQKMYEDGEILRVKVEAMEKENYFAFPETLDFKKTRSKPLHLLSPFDNSVIQRKQLRNLFNFDYQIECYLPEAKRKFGYFCLPILYDRKFVGRIDCKADRHSKRLLIRSLHFEKGVDKTKLKPLLKKKLASFAHFNGCLP